MMRNKKLYLIVLTIIMVLSSTNFIFAESEELEIEKTEEDFIKELLEIEKQYERMKEEKEKRDKEMKDKELLLKDGIAEGIPVLLYHHILPQSDIDEYDWKGNYSVLSLEDFEAQMNYLHREGYYTATTEELERFILGEIDLPKKTVVITFDDGYLSNLVHAYPVMKKYNQKGTIFIIGNSNDREKEEYSPESLQRIYIPEANEYTDVFEFQCHTYDLHDVVNGNTKLMQASKEEIEEDLNKSKGLFGATSIAYPSGKYEERLYPILEGLGYKSAFTVEPGVVKKGTHLYTLPRYIIGPGINIESFARIVNIK